MIELIIKIASLVGTLVSVGVAVWTWMNGRASKMRDDYRFANEFLANATGNTTIHHFVLAKGYQALAKSNRATIAEVKYILTLKDSPSRLKDFVLGYSYLQYTCTAEEQKISFKEKFSSASSRDWRKTVYFLGYVGLSLFMMSPFILGSVYEFSPLRIATLFSMTLPAFGPAAVLSLMEVASIFSAEKLINLQCPGIWQRPVDIHKIQRSLLVEASII